MRAVFEVRGEDIQFDQLLKAAMLVALDGAAHTAVAPFHVSVDGRTETRSTPSFAQANSSDSAAAKSCWRLRRRLKCPRSRQAPDFGAGSSACLH